MKKNKKQITVKHETITNGFVAFAAGVKGHGQGSRSFRNLESCPIVKLKLLSF